jgi:polyhydroxyalkanoate synthesis regulator phasin
MKVMLMSTAGVELASIRQELDMLRSTLRTKGALELQEAKTRVEKFIEELKSYSENASAKSLYDDLEDLLMELTFKIETLTRHCKSI